MTGKVLFCSKSRSLVIKGAANDVVARPAGDSARALQQFSDRDRHRLSDGAVLFVPGRYRTASPGWTRTGGGHQRKISWIDQRQSGGGGPEGDDGRQAHYRGARPGVRTARAPAVSEPV